MADYYGSGASSGRPLTRSELEARRKRTARQRRFGANGSGGGGSLFGFRLFGVTIGPVELVFILAIVLVLGAEVRLLSLPDAAHHPEGGSSSPGALSSSSLSPEKYSNGDDGGKGSISSVEASLKLLRTSQTAGGKEIKISQKKKANTKPPQGIASAKDRAKEMFLGRTGKSWSNDEGMPKVEELMKIVSAALAPFMSRYLRRTEACSRGFSQPKKGYFLSGCVQGDGCKRRQTLDEAKKACEAIAACGGITLVGGKSFELRTDTNPEHSPDGSEWSWVKLPCEKNRKTGPAKRATREGIWDAFSRAMDKALDNPELNLDADLGDPRDDDSIFLSVASYRDPSCRATLRKAFARADRPEKLFVGIVQQNCNHDCMTGTGWGNTRRWVPSGPDPDCVEDFCASAEGGPHCDAHRVRIIRLPEVEALGPFFTRYLNAKLYRGEEFYMQIDAHTDFRQGWDSTLVEMMKKTPSYPYSVISNYPPGGKPEDTASWPKYSGSRRSTPSALCTCTFEDAGGTHMTVRLGQSSRSLTKSPNEFATGVPIPRHSCFVAAGFYIAHGSIVKNVPFDPFLPYLFMGEEIALTIRFWTSGYDIYGPSADVLRHEYVRKEHPKFWETVTMVFSNGGIHNALTDLIIPRVQHLCQFPEAKRPDQVEPRSLLVRMDEFNVGTKRSVEDFASMMGLDFGAHTQDAPQWCKSGSEPPFVNGPSEHFLKVKAQGYV